MSKQRLSTLPTDFSINSEDGGGLRLSKNTKIICDVDSFFMIKNENEDTSVLTQDERLYPTDPLPKETLPAVRLGNENQDSLNITPEKDVANVVLPDRTPIEIQPLESKQATLLELPAIEGPSLFPVPPSIPVSLTTQSFEDLNFLPEDENQQTFNIYDTATIYEYDPKTDSNIPRETVRIEIYNNLQTTNATTSVAGFDQDSIRTALNTFITAGYTKAQAAGIVGVLLGESSLDPTEVSKKSGALGIAQFLGNKPGSELYDFLKTFNLDLGYSTQPSQRKSLYPALVNDSKFPNLQQQLDFLKSRLANKYPGVKRSIQNTSTPAEAALKYVSGYEKPGVASVGYYQNIQKYANQIFKQF